MHSGSRSDSRQAAGDQEKGDYDAVEHDSDAVISNKTTYSREWVRHVFPTLLHVCFLLRVSASRSIPSHRLLYFLPFVKSFEFWCPTRDIFIFNQSMFSSARNEGNDENVSVTVCKTWTMLMTFLLGENK